MYNYRSSITNKKKYESSRFVGYEDILSQSKYLKTGACMSVNASSALLVGVSLSFC